MITERQAGKSLGFGIVSHKKRWTRRRPSNRARLGARWPPNCGQHRARPPAAAPHPAGGREGGGLRVGGGKGVAAAALTELEAAAVEAEMTRAAQVVA